LVPSSPTSAVSSLEMSFYLILPAFTYKESFLLSKLAMIGEEGI
jgi:hypothetical protein